jgi:GWxTD domain-containing protein
MNNGYNRRILFALGAILLSLLGLTARGVSALPKKDAWYTQHYIIMQDFERKAYRTLSEGGRKAFQELFWAARNAQARADYQARMDYVMKNFWKENARQPWNTDRSRVYLLDGNPASIEVDQNVDWTMLSGGQVAQATSRSNEDVGANRAELWIYSFGQNLIKYIFVFAQPNQWKIASTGNRYLGQLEDYNKNVVFGITDLEKYKQDLAALDKKK